MGKMAKNGSVQFQWLRVRQPELSGCADARRRGAWAKWANVHTSSTTSVMYGAGAIQKSLKRKAAARRSATTAA